MHDDKWFDYNNNVNDEFSDDDEFDDNYNKNNIDNDMKTIDNIFQQHFNKNANDKKCDIDEFHDLFLIHKQKMTKTQKSKICLYYFTFSTY